MRKCTSTTKTPKKRGINGRDKGQRGERAVGTLLSTWWGSDFARTPMSGGFRNAEFREEWNAEGDLVTPDETFPFSVEVKWHEDWTLDQLITAPKSEIWSWWEQTDRQTPAGKIPLLVFKRNHMPWYYMIPATEAWNIPEPYITVNSITGLKLQVGLLRSLFETEKEQWL